MGQKSAIIIGSGFAGLGLAAMLAKTGWQVTVLEKNEQSGGRASVKRVAGFTFDMGPSWYLMPEVFEHFFELLGEKTTDHLRLVRLKPSYRVFYEGQGLSIDMFGDQAKDFATAEQLEPGVTDRLQKYLQRAKFQYEVSMARFLYKNVDSFLDFISWRTAREAAGLSLLTPMQRYVETRFADQRLRQLLMYQLVFLGSSPRRTPALYSLMSHIDWTQGVFYPLGGIGELPRSVERIAVGAGAEVRCLAPVQRIIIEDDRAVGVELENGEIVRAEVVISNADYHFTETKLLPEKYRARSEKWWHNRTLAPSAFIMYLGVRGRVPALTHHNLLFAQNWDQHFAQIFDQPSWPSDPSFYVCAPSVTDSTVAPPNHENLFILVPIAAGLDYSPTDLQQYGDQVIKKMENEMGCVGLAERVMYREHFCVKDFATRYNSQGGSALGLAHTLSQTAIFRPPNVSRKVKGLYYVGAGTVPGIGLPMCLISAELVYKRLIGDVSEGRLAKL